MLLFSLVDFPIENFDLTSYVASKSLPNELYNEEIEKSDKPLLYDLIGISNHFGSTGGGHYTAYCK